MSVVGYARRNVAGGNVEEQARRIQEFCDRHGLEYHGLFVEGRPEDGGQGDLGRFEEDRKEGDVVIVTSMDRLSRDPAELQEIMSRWRRKGVLAFAADGLLNERDAAAWLANLPDAILKAELVRRGLTGGGA
jgi:DNA invertase Pin-like site-specific DNA recombinase